jgi:heptosyltransferase III
LRKTILVIRPGALGDTILTLPLVESISTERPDAAITFLGNGSYRDLMAPGISLQPIDGPDWLWLFIDPPFGQTGSTPVFDTAYVILGKSREVVSNLRQSGTRSVLWTSSRPTHTRHIVEHVHDGLGLPIPPRKPALLHLSPGTRKDLIWIHPGTGGPKKCVDLRYITQVAHDLADSTGLNLAVTVTEQDAFLWDLPEWQELVNHPRTALYENRPLLEICRELGAARLFIGNDSGISHLAAGLGIPAAVFFTATDPVQWMPWVPSENLLILDLRKEAPSPALLCACLNRLLA